MPAVEIEPVLPDPRSARDRGSAGWPADESRAERELGAVWSGEPLSRGRGLEGSGSHEPLPEAANFMLETYWQASGRAWTIAALSARVQDPRERGFLVELRAAEERRMAIARRALKEIWGIALARCTNRWGSEKDRA